MIRFPYNPLKENERFNLPLTSLKGIGPKKAEEFFKRGVHSIADLLFFFPIRYQDKRNFTPICSSKEGRAVLVKGKIVKAEEKHLPRSRRRMFRALLLDSSGSLELAWFNYRRAYLFGVCRPGSTVVAYGKVRARGGRLQMAHPEITAVEKGDSPRPEGVVPVYPFVEAVGQGTIRSLIKEAWEKVGDDIEEILPLDVLGQLELPILKDALSALHFPPSHFDLEELNSGRAPCQRRLTFGLIFELMASVLTNKAERENLPAAPLRIPRRGIEEFEVALPFELTGDQRRAILQIAKDMGSGKVMNRLVQGDVGCGKTVVALASAYICAVNGGQAALMAPTQVLSKQHYRYFLEMGAALGLKPVLITGEDTGRRRGGGPEEMVRSGKANVVIGTHALIQDRVKFHDLRLVIIDEQQRFGVRQRRALEKKGQNPHVLVMTATPIPRTLAMTIYADMDMSMIKTMPANRKKVRTIIVHEREKRVIYEMVKATMERGGQVIVVCPVIQEHEGLELKDAANMYEALIRIYSPPYRIGFVHGGLPDKEKNRVMDGFRQGGMDLLVATTVVEVGVHAPGASLIVIEHPERFGLAQLHQLRGRVGRAGREGTCVLVVRDSIGEAAMERLRNFSKCQDGFQIAEQDLKLRGLGELTGLKQAGRGEMDLRVLMENMDLVEAAKEEIQKILRSYSKGV